MTLKLKNYQYAVRLVGAIAASSLVFLSDYQENQWSLWLLLLAFILLSTLVRFVRLSAKAEFNLHIGMQYVDVVMMSLGIALRGGQRSDFYLGYYLILGYVMMMAVSRHMTRLSLWIVLCYSAVSYFATPAALFSPGRLIIRLVLIVGTAIALHGYTLEIIHYRSKIDLAMDMAFKDTLTGAYNRRMMQYISEESDDTPSNLHIVLMDLDDFKAVNDTYGHSAGDDVLIALVDTIKGYLGPDDLCIRYGGEEFLLVFHTGDTRHVQETLHGIKTAFGSLSFPWMKACEKLTFTAGIVAADGHRTMDNIIDEVDMSLYVGKNSGKNCLVQDNCIV